MVVKKEPSEGTHTDDFPWLDEIEEEICEKLNYPLLGDTANKNSSASSSQDKAKISLNGDLDELKAKEIQRPKVDSHRDVSQKKNGKEKKYKIETEKLESKEVAVDDISNTSSDSPFTFRFEVDGIAVVLFIGCFITRIIGLKYPGNIVFDELHYAKYVSMYMQRMFFFDSNPPLGKQLIALGAYLAGYDGIGSFSKIGAPYTANVPVITMRLVPAIFGSLLAPLTYKVGLELGFWHWTAFLGAAMIVLDTALLTQSRLILMEPILIFFALFGIYGALRLKRLRYHPFTFSWWKWLSLSIISLTAAVCVKYSGIYAYVFGVFLLLQDFWQIVPDKTFTRRHLCLNGLARGSLLCILPLFIYLGSFYIHLSLLIRAGPHDSIMSSSFQASLEGGLASIISGQPLEIVHGSQITLRRRPSPPCWLHSHPKVYPIRYPDKRGSSHQQQVTCYRYKDVNNWWIVKRPEINDLVAHPPLSPIKHGDIIQLVHGMTSRALNTHDVAAPVSPSKQEVSCYIDYEVNMKSQNLWRVEIINRDSVGDVWHIVESQVQFVHVNTSHALSTSGRILPEWGAHQDEVVGEKSLVHPNTIWNVEEHRHTEGKTQQDREKEMVYAEMIPTAPTQIPLWAKFLELQGKMLLVNQENVKSHMYSSDPLYWPLMDRGIAYYISNSSNAQIHLIGNVVSWNTGALCVIAYSTIFLFYLVRRRRAVTDLTEEQWKKFVATYSILVLGFLFNYIPYFYLDQTLFLHHYLPCLVYKFMIISAVIQHVDFVLGYVLRLTLLRKILWIGIGVWFIIVCSVFISLCPLSYGTYPFKADEIRQLEWKENWDFIIHKT